MDGMSFVFGFCVGMLSLVFIEAIVIVVTNRGKK